MPHCWMGVQNEVIGECMAFYIEVCQHFTQTSTAAPAGSAALLRGRTSLLLRWTWYTFSAGTQDRGLSSGGMVTPYSHPVECNAQTMALCLFFYFSETRTYCWNASVGLICCYALERDSQSPDLTKCTNSSYSFCRIQTFGWLTAPWSSTALLSSTVHSSSHAQPGGQSNSAGWRLFSPFCATQTWSNTNVCFFSCALVHWLLVWNCTIWIILLSGVWCKAADQIQIMSAVLECSLLRATSRAHYLHVNVRRSPRRWRARRQLSSLRRGSGSRSGTPHPWTRYVRHLPLLTSWSTRYTSAVGVLKRKKNTLSRHVTVVEIWRPRQAALKVTPVPICKKTIAQREKAKSFACSNSECLHVGRNLNAAHTQSLYKSNQDILTSIYNLCFIHTGKKVKLTIKMIEVSFSDETYYACCISHFAKPQQLMLETFTP